METLSQTSGSNNQNEQLIPKSNVEINNWTQQHEEIFIEWADKAMIYRWMHTRSFKIFSMRNAYFTIPVIIMSTISGTATFAQDRFPEDVRSWVQVAVGTINITAGILTTIQQFLKINELNEAHRVSSITWGKFYENIKIELAKHPKYRDPPLEMLKHFKEEFDRLMEVSPTIEDAVINEFKVRFSDKKNKDMLNESAVNINTRYSERFKQLFTSDEFMDEDVNLHANDLFSNYMGDMKKFNKAKSKNHYAYLKKPDICDELVSTSETMRPWYNVRPKKDDEDGKQIQMIEDPAMVKQIEQRKEKEIYKKMVDEFCKKYFSINERYPFENEIIDNLQHNIPMDSLKSVIKHLEHSNV